MATKEGTVGPTRLAGRVAKLSWPRISAAGWAALMIAALFIVCSCWWLATDRSVPIDDSALHIGAAFDAYEALAAGHLLKALTGQAPYPPLTFLIGALGVAVGGISVAPPILAQNLVFVPLLAVGCYQVGRLAFGRFAGILAVAFALGAPMIVEEFHEFMLDAPEAAMVAIAVWAILTTERFMRPRACALAGVAVGLGMLSKETFVFFVAGAVLATVILGGRRGLRGFAVFAATALLISLPWYLYELTTLHTLGGEAFGSSSHVSTIRGIAPPRLSLANIEWYFWSFLNWELFLPFAAFVAVGMAWAAIAWARRKPSGRYVPELACGTFVAWLTLTMTYVHDPRYAMPMTVYLAVFAVGWITRLPRKAAIAGSVALLLAAFTNTLGVAFGVGETVATSLENLSDIQQPGILTIYSNYGFWVGPPARDGDTLALLRALRRDGIGAVRWYSVNETEMEFSPPGIALLARIAGLRVPGESLDPAKAPRSDAFLLHREPGAGLPRPCIVLRDGSGVWVGRGGPSITKDWDYCPLRSG